MAVLQSSGIFKAGVIEEIQAKAESGLYAMRGFGTLRERRWAFARRHRSGSAMDA